MAAVPGDTFDRSNNPNYSAKVDGFVLDRFEITVGRFRRFVEAYPASKPVKGAGAHPLIDGSGWDPGWDDQLPTDKAALEIALDCDDDYSTWTSEAQDNDETRPMNCITWFEAFAFCAWDGGRLPTEVEWNHAAAGGSEQREYPWSNPPGSTKVDATYAVYDCAGDGSATEDCSAADILPVGSKSPKGDGKWGHADLAGSIWEWNLDWYHESYVTPCDNCADLAATDERVGRGGYWSDAAYLMLSSYRDPFDPTARANDTGGRCVRIP